MYKVSLINLPFADVAVPSLALLQLKAVAEDSAGGEVRVRVLNLNNDFAKFLGLELYHGITGTLDANMYGLGEWFFRPWAFPDIPDNEAEYFNRCFRTPGSFVLRHRRAICEKRQQAAGVLSEIVERYQLAGEDLVGTTSMFCQNLASFGMARELKRRNRTLVTVLGGANCEWPMGEALARHLPDVDFVFSGPALKSFPRLLQALMTGDAEGCHAIDGVFSKRNVAGSRNLLQSGPSVGQLGEDLPIDHEIVIDYAPFLDALEQEFDRTVKPALLFETSRGCWWGERAHCTFCGLNKMTMGFRSMPVDKALRQFDRLFGYADRCSQFSCVDNIMPKEYVTEVLAHLQPPDHISMFYEVKADLTREDLGILARARVTSIQPGIEALSTSTLKLMKKGTSAFSNLVFLKNCRDAGIQPSWNLLVGFPGEQEPVFEKYVRDLPLLAHLYPPSGVYQVRFDRYSPYFKNAAEYKLDLHANDWYSYVYPFDRKVIEQIAYYFANHDFDANYLHALAKYMKAMQQLVDAWRVRWSSRAEVPPQLTLAGDGDDCAIVDTRFAAPRRYSLGPDERRLLEFLSVPRREADVVRELGAGGARLLDWGFERDLLFEEDGRVLSLALDARIDSSVGAGRSSDERMAAAAV